MSECHLRNFPGFFSIQKDRDSKFLKSSPSSSNMLCLSFHCFGQQASSLSWLIFILDLALLEEKNSEPTENASSNIPK